MKNGSRKKEREKKANLHNCNFKTMNANSKQKC
jgi:hypothetical protein